MIRQARERKDVFLAILGISWFWFLGVVFLTQIPAFTRQTSSSPMRSVANLIIATFTDRHRPRLDRHQLAAQGRSVGQICAGRRDPDHRLHRSISISPPPALHALAPAERASCRSRRSSRASPAGASSSIWRSSPSSPASSACRSMPSCSQARLAAARPRDRRQQHHQRHLHDGGDRPLLRSDRKADCRSAACSCLPASPMRSPPSTSASCLPQELVAYLARLLFRLLYRVEVKGLENFHEAGRARGDRRQPHLVPRRSPAVGLPAGALRFRHQHPHGQALVGEAGLPALRSAADRSRPIRWRSRSGRGGEARPQGRDLSGRPHHRHRLPDEGL